MLGESGVRHRHILDGRVGVVVLASGSWRERRLPARRVGAPRAAPGVARRIE
ncbi:hypothetical protein CSB93_2179 [Pseudomonas paraeruginosa]|uniref:Uncharacterized protein n=1 Tax=Pseudomonas paraeruginosa TaxID=2994495 RepID=A0A2R3IYZ1_9PSED|nr:hypothetical protein CSB93_2179 [Pseudomonas paraeruginosa]AWE89875.1 hypothetical protein CSC28_0946 [Pseudomonas paraeruginosa]PTC38799.1 hypothetical protein CLJ1_0771 [Pseudomonas aeruginosa]